MPIKANQLIAVEKGVKSRAHSLISDLYKTLQKPELFNGFVRSYRPLDDAAPKLPGEKQIVRARAQDLLASIRVSESQLIDITVQKDTVNQVAKASVYIDGKELIKDLPVTSLLFFEKKLEDYRAAFNALPVLDAAEEWDWDDKAGLYRTAPVETHRTKKVAKAFELAKATDKHPAQVSLVQEDVLDGYWQTIKHSAAVPYTDKKEMLERLDKLIIAFKQAREVANDTYAQERTDVSPAIFNYLLDSI